MYTQHILDCKISTTEESICLLEMRKKWDKDWIWFTQFGRYRLFFPAKKNLPNQPVNISTK